MKLPKGFGGQGFGGMLQQAQQAMARAKQLEEELERERIPMRLRAWPSLHNPILLRRACHARGA